MRIITQRFVPVVGSSPADDRLRGPAEEVREVSFDHTAVDRAHQVIHAMQLENVRLAGLALGARAYWSVIAYCEARALRNDSFRDNPDSITFIDGDRSVFLTEVPVWLDPYAAGDSVRPLVFSAGTRLALQ